MARPKKTRSPGADLVQAQPRALADLARHLGRGAAADVRSRRVPGDLERAPDEARAVVAAVDLRAVVVVGGAVGLAAPDVGHADLRDRDPQRAPRCAAPYFGRLKAESVGAGVLGRPRVLERGGQRMRGLGAGDRLPRVELERLVGERVVRAQAHRPGDDLGAEVARRPQPGLAGDVLHVRGDVGEPELLDEPGVEGGDRDGRGGAARDRRGLRERRQRGGELRAGERALAVEAAVAQAREQAGGGDLLLLVEVPVRAGGGVGGRGGGQRRDNGEQRHETAHRHSVRLNTRGG